MGGFFSGLAGSLGNKLHEMHVENLNNQITSKRNLLDNYQVLLQDPHLADVHGDIIGALMKAAGTDPTKLHKQITKPGGEFDPTQWQVLAQQRASGQASSPVNQGQNPSMIPAAPIQHDGTPGGGAQMAPPWNNAGGGSSVDGSTAAGSAAITPPPPPPQASSAVSGMGAQSVQGLPPAPGSPAPSGVEVVSPQAAAATSQPQPAATPTMIPPPPASIYQGNGSLTDQEMKRRALSQQTALDEAKYSTSNKYELQRQSALNSQKTDEDLRAKRGHIKLIEELQKQHPDWPMPLILAAATGSSMAGMGAMSRPVPLGTLRPSSSVPPELLLDEYGQPIDPDKYPHVQAFRNQMTGQTFFAPTEIRAEFTPHLGINPDGTTGFQTASNAAKSGAPTSSGFVAPSMLPTEHSGSSTTDAAGNVRTASNSHKIPPPPAAGAGSPPIATGAASRSARPATAGSGNTPSTGGSRPPATKFEQQRSDQSYNNAQKELDTISKPIGDLVVRMTRLQDTIAQNTPQADALVAPELLTVMSGGAGSGLRMNEAEIQRIVGGRSHWEDLKSRIARWQLDPSKPFLITPEQRQQIRDLVKTVAQRVQEKQDAVNKAYESLGTETDPAKHRLITTGLRRTISDIEQGKAQRQQSSVGAPPASSAVQSLIDKYK